MLSNSRAGWSNIAAELGRPGRCLLAGRGKPLTLRQPIKLFAQDLFMLAKSSSNFHLGGALILLLASAVVSAETLPLKHYTTSHGLAHDRVNRIVRDSRGFLWFCTAEGLSRFDGYQFKNYTRDEGLPHARIYDLLETSDGNYWVATGDGLVLFNPQGLARRWRGTQDKATTNNESLMFRVFHPADPGPTNSWSIVRLQMGGPGILWALTSWGLYRVDQQGGRDWKLTMVDKPEWRGKRDFDDLLFDKSGAVWLGGVNCLFRMLPNGSVQTIAKDHSISSLMQDEAGDIWAGTRGEGEGGLYQYSLSDSNVPELRHRFTTGDGLGSNYWLNALLETREGKFWVGCGGGLCERVKHAGNNTPMFRRILETGVSALVEDTGGNLWMGTETSGAVRLSRNGFKSFGEKDGLKPTRIYSIINGLKGEVFILSGNASGTIIHRFDDGKFISVTPSGVIQST